MRIDYKGQTEANSNDRVGVISSVKEKEINQLEGYLKKHNINFSTFGNYEDGICTYNIYVSVDDRADFEELRDIYKEFKKIMNGEI